jgi:hypothetical protein
VQLDGAQARHVREGCAHGAAQAQVAQQQPHHVDAVALQVRPGGAARVAVGVLRAPRAQAAQGVLQAGLELQQSSHCIHTPASAGPSDAGR